MNEDAKAHAHNIAGAHRFCILKLCSFYTCNRAMLMKVKDAEHLHFVVAQQTSGKTIIMAFFLPVRSRENSKNDRIASIYAGIDLAALVGADLAEYAQRCSTAEREGKAKRLNLHSDNPLLKQPVEVKRGAVPRVAIVPATFPLLYMFYFMFNRNRAAIAETEIY